MTPIPLATLRALWEREGPHGPWRRVLKEGYALGEPYFEFGVMPENDPAFGDYRIILDHKIPLRLCPKSCPFVGEYVIRPGGQEATDDIRQGEHGFRYHTFYVAPDVYERDGRECASIYSQYRYDEGVTFWGIPDKWFSETLLIHFIRSHITNLAYFLGQPRTRFSFYWP